MSRHIGVGDPARRIGPSYLVWGLAGDTGTFLVVPHLLKVDVPDPVAEEGPVKAKSTEGSDDEDREQRPYRCSVHAFDGSPPDRHSLQVLMLWRHKAPLCPSLPDALVARSTSPVLNRPPAGSGDRGRSRHPARSGGWLALAAGEHMALVYVLGTTGLRFGEAAELRWRDVDFAGLRLRVTRSVTFVSGHPVVGTPKNGKDRTVALPATVARMLAPGADDALVVPDSAGAGCGAAMCAVAGGPRPYPTPGCRPTSSCASCGTPPHAWRYGRGRTLRRCRTCWATPRRT